MLSTGKASIVNLKLTSDGRLIYSESNKDSANTFIDMLEDIKRNNKLLDKEALIALVNFAIANEYSVSTVEICGNNCKIYKNIAKYNPSSYYIISKSNREHFILIQDSINTLDEGWNTGYAGACNLFKKHVKGLAGTVYVVGCVNVESFYDEVLKSCNLPEWTRQKVKSDLYMLKY